MVKTTRLTLAHISAASIVYFLQSSATIDRYLYHSSPERLDHPEPSPEVHPLPAWHGYCADIDVAPPYAIPFPVLCLLSARGSPPAYNAFS